MFFFSGFEKRKTVFNHISLGCSSDCPRHFENIECLPIFYDSQKKDLPQIQERYEVADWRLRRAVWEAALIDKQTVLDTTKFTEEDITEAHVMKHVRCITGCSGSAVWQELYSNEEHCKKIMENSIQGRRNTQKQLSK